MQIAEAGNASWKAGDGTEIDVQLLQICQLQYLLRHLHIATQGCVHSQIKNWLEVLCPFTGPKNKHKSSMF